MTNDAISRLTAALADRYTIERELGAGGMATVYLAQDLRHDRKVAIKVLKPELAAVLGAERFVVEIKTTAALQHPHILPLFDSGSADGFLFYVMPFIDGETLRGKLDRETQLGIDEAVRIAAAVADALDYAHRQGVIHRDIKPENILLHDGRPMVADFGIALALSAAAGGRMTETGMSLGTPHYMSPEQATADKEITGRSDIYSLASVCYEMLTGNPPHTGSSAQQIIMKIIAEQPAAVTQYRKSVPPNVAAAVGKALEKLPADRFATAKEFAEALGNPGFVTATTGQVVARQSVVSSRLILLLGGVTLASLALATWSLLRDQPTGPTTFDAAFPDSAMMWPVVASSFALAPDASYLIYQSRDADGTPLLRYRSLRDGTQRPLEGTRNAAQPVIAPDGERVAFLQYRDSSATVVMTTLGAGAPVSLADVGTDAILNWLPDGRIIAVDGDGTLARWIDPAGGATVQHPVFYCMLPTALPGDLRLLCGGGGGPFAYEARAIGDSIVAVEWWTADPDSSALSGSQFRVIDDRYLVYLSLTGDLMAAPVDMATGRIGRSVRFESGIARQAYSGYGSWAVAPNGTLVYATGPNQPVAHMVRVGDGGMDTLPVGMAAFLRFRLSPDNRHFAAVVEGRDDQELRVYDLTTGSNVTWARARKINQPVWSPTGDRLFYTTQDSAYVGALASAGRARALPGVGTFEAFQWLPGDAIVGVNWDRNLGLTLQLGANGGAMIDTLIEAAGFLQVSPDRRWVAYNAADLRSLWLEPLPRTGERYLLINGAVEDAQWLSPTEFAVQRFNEPPRLERFRIVARPGRPVEGPLPWVATPRILATAGESYAVTSDGHAIYAIGDEERPGHFVRVVPGWVKQMKRAVDEANR